MSSKRAAGFTLLEMIIAMAIVAIFIGTAASFALKSTSKEFLEMEASLTGFVRETRVVALNQQAAYYVHFRENKIWRSKNSSLEKESSEIVELPPSAELFVQVDDKWKKISDKVSHTWLFSRSGICDSISIRLDYEGSSLETSFDPLTALPANREN